jgi:hypothetical protein
VESVWPRLTKQPKSIAGRGAGGATLGAEYGILYRMGTHSTSLTVSPSRCLVVSSSRLVLSRQAGGRLHDCSPHAQRGPNGGTLGIWPAAVGSILRGRAPNDASMAANHMAGFPSAMSGCRVELSSRRAHQHCPGRYAGRRSQQHSAFQPTAAAFTQQSSLRPVGVRTASTRWGPRWPARLSRRRHGRR